ncbi:MAG: enoyl-ACP reductase FabI, partial [Thiohalospira sp.]
MGFLSGKRALIVGLASNRSIAWGIARAMHREGAELAFTYQNDKLQSRVEDLAGQLGSEITMPMDVSSDEEIEAAFNQLDNYWDGLDIIVHAVAFAPKSELEGNYLDAVTREGFRTAHEISSYSFAALAKAARPMMEGRNGSLITLSYLGAERAMPNYNVMGLAKASLEANVRYMADALGPDGIRVNAVSAGPIRTLAASGISDFKRMLEEVEANAPLRKNVTI